VAALAIDNVGPRSYHFHLALPRALPRGQEAKKVKSLWSIVLLSVYNVGKPFSGRSSALDPAGGAYNASQAP